MRACVRVLNMHDDLLYLPSWHHGKQCELSWERHGIDDFRGACAVKGNVQVAGRTSSVSTTEMLSTHDVTLRNVDGSLFHVQINLICHGASGPKWAKLKEYFSIYNVIVTE